ncbi:hypothetical protein M9Y10_012114 [Tritrichomonas musculus]|uniref:Uncharacterized protein n=1 Tax=Tritrichomonas musculus TaxID=1915356 RepID=A0ABR2ICS6_9EUKA
MNLFDQINKLRTKQSSSSTTTTTSSSSAQSSDDETSHSNDSPILNNNDDDDNEEINSSDNEEFDYNNQQSSFWKQGASESWGPTLIEYRIQPNRIEKKLGMLQNSLVIPEYDPFKPNISNKAKKLYELPNVSQIEIEDIMSQRGLFDE